MSAALAGRRARRAVERAIAGSVVTVIDSTPWASVTFAGARTRLRVEGPVPGDAVLREIDLPMPGYVAADLDVLMRDAGGCVVEVLTIADA